MATVTTIPVRTFCVDQQAGPPWRARSPSRPNHESVRRAPPADEGLEKVADLTPTVVVMNMHTPGLDVAGAS